MSKRKVKALLDGNRIVSENSNEARELYNKSTFGELLEDGRVQFSSLEAYYLTEKGKLEVLDGRGKAMDRERLYKRLRRKRAQFPIRYQVFSDLRKRGYVVKTALKFGADFRVYDRGVKPGEDHARWLVYAVHETNTLTWQDFSAKNRVATSTKKRLLVGVVDDEGDVSYWEVRWLRP